MIFISQCKYLQPTQLPLRFYQCYPECSLVTLLIVADDQWCELETEMNKLYHQAVEQVPTGEHYTLSLDTLYLGLIVTRSATQGLDQLMFSLRIWLDLM